MELWEYESEKGYNWRRRKDEEYVKKPQLLNVGHVNNGGSRGFLCCRKCEEIVHLRKVITGLKECVDHLQQVAECEKFVGNSWLRLWREVAEDFGSG